MAALVSREQLEASVRRQLDGPAADEALAESSQIVRSYLGQDLDLVGNEVVLLNGTGKASLILPQVPIVGLDLVRVADDNGTLLALAPADYYLEPKAGILWRTLGAVWPAGRGNVEATVDHGYAACPADIRAVVMSVAMRLYHAHAERPGMRTEQLGASSYTRDDSATLGLVGLEKQILDRHRLPGVPAA